MKHFLSEDCCLRYCYMLCRFGVAIVALVHPLICVTQLRAWQQLMSTPHFILLGIGFTPIYLKRPLVATCRRMSIVYPGARQLSNLCQCGQGHSTFSD